MVQYFTKQGLQKLKDELHQLKTVENKRIVNLIAEAAAFGDLKENSAYHDARDKMAFLRMRIAELEAAINEAVVKEKSDDDKIQVGSRVKILFSAPGGPASGWGEPEAYEIVAPGEANVLKNKISYQSPLGQMLVGQKVGKEFNFEPGAKKIKVKILEIE